MADLYCIRCHAGVSKDAQFCPACGQKVDREIDQGATSSVRQPDESVSVLKKNLKKSKRGCLSSSGCLPVLIFGIIVLLAIIGFNRYIHIPLFIPVFTTFGNQHHIVKVAVGDDYSLAIKDDGSLWAWGENGDGQLGDGSTTDNIFPKQIIPSGVTAVAVGMNHSLAIKTDGSLWAWGNNEYGQLGNGTTTDSANPKQIIPSGVTVIAAGGFDSLAVKDDGSLWAWGGKLYDETEASSERSRRRLDVGSLTPKQIISSGVTAAAVGTIHSYAVKTDGSLWSWSVTYESKHIIANGVATVAAGDFHGLVLKTDGSVWAGGSNIYGQLGDGTKTSEMYTPFKLIIPSGVKAIAAGMVHSLVLKTDGSLWAWGDNQQGQLGDGTKTESLVPKQISFNGATVIAAGGSSSLAIKTDGSLWAWGNGAFPFISTAFIAALILPTVLLLGISYLIFLVKRKRTT